MPTFKFTIRAWFAPAVLLLAAILTFGLLIPWLGFYWDDWAKILVSRLFGLSRYFAYYAGDRPLSAWTHIVFTPLLGNHPLGWQILALLLRWLSAWGLYACLALLWPNARRQNLAAALIFLVYPAFTQQPAAVTFFQQWLQYALFFLSLFAMLKAVLAAGRLRWAWTGLSLAAMLLQFSVTEYFIPVELVRPLMLWLLLSRPDLAAGPLLQTGRRRGLQVLTLWAPYLVGLAAFAIWRLFFFQLVPEDPYRANTLFQFFSSPLSTLRELGGVFLVDFSQILFGAWTQLLQGALFSHLTPFTLLAYGLAVFGAVLLSGLLLLTPEPQGSQRDRWVRQALGLGLLAALLGPVPAWITGRQVVFDFHSDRYALPALFGASLMWVAAIEWLAQKRLQRAVLTGLLLVFAISLHLRAANEYRWIWTEQQRLYWELAWRVPGLEPGTALYFEDEPFPNQGLFSTSAAVNLLYPQPAGQPRDPQTGDPQLAYWVYTLRPRFQYDPPPASFDIGIATRFRTLQFSGRLDDSLLLYKDPQVSNCLWLLSERDINHPRLPQLVKDFLPISDTGRIRLTARPGYPPADLFGPEPEHNWCYFFEKADLARQYADWDEVVRLGDAAQAAGYQPDVSASNSPYEWMPFIEGYAHAGRWDQATELTLAASRQDPRYSPMLCQLWSDQLPIAFGSGEALHDLSIVTAGLSCQAAP